MLTAGDVNPSMNAMYNATRVWQTLKDSLGFDPSIACEYDKVGVLWEEIAVHIFRQTRFM